ncbi:hypothetical protein MANES_12G089598v8 [Manihot esculenta]|uniref:Uncharacterized protein n=2 Tax=Manihot esculenta TaxID=3983 RepID=A0ACB7GRD9_MANES|nr:hypothetical protein MANES_12G089598v8 [Manihot esculenta]KAG8642489.1 hypothetical protein MANES_12G089598v8 [Manihot esculenta]
MLSATRAFTLKFSLPSFAFSTKTCMESPPRSPKANIFNSSCRSPSRKADAKDTGYASITLQEWQGWGTTSPVPAKVLEVVEDFKLLEKANDAQMTFGGSGGKLQGEFKIQEDKKHRATYEALGDSEKKIQFFSARQIACRVLGSRDYLCQKCWLPLEEDCMCSKVKHSSLWPGVRFWLYMHPKDFLRQNNTGKLLWQVFGVQSATLCLFGIPEHEEIMWNAFKLAGKDKVWCLYPNKNAVTMSVYDAFGQGFSADLEHSPTVEQTKSVWGEEDLPCISLVTGASTMHKLRPQPSWDRTCTAAAAIGLLSELQCLPGFNSCGLDKQVEALEDALVVLLEALTARRLRMGRSITRKVRHISNIC